MNNKLRKTLWLYLYMTDHLVTMRCFKITTNFTIIFISYHTRKDMENLQCDNLNDHISEKIMM